MNRFKSWAMSVFSSMLVLVSLLNNFFIDKSSKTREIRVIVLCTPTIIISIAGVITSMSSKGNVETILILLNLIVWIIIGIATLVDNSMFEVTSDLQYVQLDKSTIGDPNIYFFSLGSLLNAVNLASSWFKQYIIRDEYALTSTQWAFLATSGFLVGSKGLSLYEPSNCDERNYNCPRRLLAISIGLISGILGCFLMSWRTAPLKCQAELALILLVIWAAAIGLLTFETGPALYINTMYLGIYLSFYYSVDIFITTVYADAVFEASPHSQVEFGRTEAQKATDELGAAGFLDIAVANITKQSEEFPHDFNDDPRQCDPIAVMMFESVGGSLSSLGLPDNNVVVRTNEKVVVGKHDFSRIEIWFLLFIESCVCLVAFYTFWDRSRSVMEQWIVLAPALSIVLSCLGWFACSMQKKWARILEIVLILACVVLLILGLIEHISYFRVETIDHSDDGTKIMMTANQLFMSYGSYFTAIYLLTHWFKTSATVTDWVFLSATSFVIFGLLFIGNAGDFQDCESHTDSQTCRLLKLETILALGSTCVSFAMALISLISCGWLMPTVHVTIGTMLLSLWCTGTYYFVFMKGGIGTEVGPAFFACWGSLFFCIDITTTNLVFLFKHQEGDREVGSSCSSQVERDNFQDDEETRRLTAAKMDDSQLYDQHNEDMERASGELVFINDANNADDMDESLTSEVNSPTYSAS